MEGGELRLFTLFALEGIMEDYKGDSPGKKFARFTYWQGVLKQMGAKAFMEKKHLILVSKEAGDIPLLLLLRVPPKNIIAVDQNPRAAYLAQEKYPQVEVVCTDVVKLAAEYKRSIGSALLDFCGYLDSGYVERVMKVVQLGLSSTAVLGCTFLCGREKDTEYLELLESYKQGFLDRSDLDYGPGEASALSALARANLLWNMLMVGGVKKGLVFKPLQLLFYMSSTKNSHGVPMCMLLMGVQRELTVNRGQKAAIRSIKENMLEMPALSVKNCNITEEELRDLILDRIEKEEKMGENGLAKHIGPAYNISAGTIAAWKAHRTRGTYQ